MACTCCSQSICLQELADLACLKLPPLAKASASSSSELCLLQPNWLRWSVTRQP